ncbi:MAG: type IX secretion system membrane protein PorP/SprF [Flavobacteriales bacterium]|nr:type IX secretion system membrane protein PorP/SprF [Flavobacteriales bacterium]
MRRLITIAILLFCLSAKSQDIHFSQFFFSPQLLSPGEIGNFNAEYRLNANQKTQWREVSRPYSTFALMGDGQFDFAPKKVAVGAVIMNDNAGDSRFNTFSILLGGSYEYSIDENDEHTIFGGLQTGLTQIRLNYDDLEFNNQYNGVVFDPNLSNGEDFARNARWYFNLNLGVTYRYSPEVRKSISGGLVLHNVNSPRQSFFNDTGVQLPLRTSLYANADWKVNEEIDAMPSFRWMDQATFTEVIFGTAARYRLIDEPGLYRAVFAGYYGRFGDSGIAMLGGEIDAWRFAISYDINVSDLEQSSRNRGGFEFSLQYLFGKKQKSNMLRHKYCPVFL